MALFGWKKKTGDGAAPATSGGAGNGNGASPKAGGSDGFKRDPRKAKAWFDRAATVADTRNYDYAIECFISGLKFDPDNMHQHEALFEVAKRRRVGGGKPAGIKERLTSMGKDPISKFLDAEKIFAKNPLDRDAALAAMEKAVAAHAAVEDLDMTEFAHWIGAKVLEYNATSKSPSKSVYIKARDLFVAVEDYDKAVEACKMALALDGADEALLIELRDLEAERTMRQAQYGEGFEKSVKDMDQQRALDAADQGAAGGSQLDMLIERAKADLEENPEDLDRLNKYVKLLETKESDQSQTEAIRLLREAWERTGQYRFHVRAGDIQIRQYNRQLRALKAQLEANPDDEAVKQQWNQLLQEARTFELNEFTDRAKNYPTDLKLRFELGKRLIAFHKYDEAISAFQEAQNDARNRAPSLYYLGICYTAKGWHDEAIDSYTRGIECHPLVDDKLGMDLRYYKMDALEKVARRDKSIEKAREARELASQLLQMNIKYRDIRERAEELRKLIDELATQKSA